MILGTPPSLEQAKGVPLPLDDLGLIPWWRRPNELLDQILQFIYLVCEDVDHLRIVFDAVHELVRR